MNLKIIFTILFFMVFSGIVEAATIYVRDCGGSCGTNDGSDWANPLDDLPTDLTRGNVYYVADGNYAEPPKEP